ncbi:hypothetical protein HK104_004017 [Borealophlyctis nickersoniae]|nr:hypothetical protein HK104_004017 [Borealophlyctis nickersoniae]
MLTPQKPVAFEVPIDADPDAAPLPVGSSPAAPTPEKIAKKIEELANKDANYTKEALDAKLAKAARRKSELDAERSAKAQAQVQRAKEVAAAIRNDSAADLAEAIKEKLDAAEERREAILEEKKQHAVKVAGVKSS